MSGPSWPPEGRRRVLARVADVLIAPAAGMPAASAVGVAGELLDRCLAAAPGLAEPLAELLDELAAPSHDAEAFDPEAGDAEAFVRRLAAERPDDFAVLSTAVVGAYYLSGVVRHLIGYPGQVPNPASVAAEPDYLEMLERVYERHPGYREAP